MGFWLTGKLGCAWVYAWVGAWAGDVIPPGLGWGVGSGEDDDGVSQPPRLDPLIKFKPK